MEGINSPGPASAQPSAGDVASDHAVPANEADKLAEHKIEASNSQGDESSIAGNKNGEPSRPVTNIDENDPFALFPMLSISMSSTHGPRHTRRATVASLGRPLTRQETLQTIKTVRSRFTEARSEFDENANFSMPIFSHITRMIFPN
jgi:hypothetical protein